VANSLINAKHDGAVTVARDFDQITFKGERLFSVRGDVPLGDAFDKLTDLIRATRDNLCTLAENPEVANVTGGLMASVHLLSISFELLQAMHEGHAAALREGGAQ
jgi:hypothetical protein